MTKTADFDHAAFVDHLEEVIYWHQAWHMRLMGSLLFGRPFPDIDYHQCHFGKFLDNTETPPGRDEEMKQIDQLHARMHQLAEQLIIGARKNRAVDEEQFDEFTETQSLFFSLTGSLLRAAIEDQARARSSEKALRTGPGL